MQHFNSIVASDLEVSLSGWYNQNLTRTVFVMATLVAFARTTKVVTTSKDN